MTPYTLLRKREWEACSMSLPLVDNSEKNQKPLREESTLHFKYCGWIKEDGIRDDLGMGIRIGGRWVYRAIVPDSGLLKTSAVLSNVGTIHRMD